MHDPGRIDDGGVPAAPSRLPILVQPQIQVVHSDLHIACGTPLAIQCHRQPQMCTCLLTQAAHGLESMGCCQCTPVLPESFDQYH